MKNRNLDHSDNWATPKSFYQKLDLEFGFDFDPCPLHAKFDGLVAKWGKCNFINPPYSRELKERFIIKAIDEARKGSTCVCLLPVSTSTKLFHDLILPNANEIRFLKGRIKFEGINADGGTSKGAGMHDSMLVVFKDLKPEVSTQKTIELKMQLKLAI